MSEKFIIAVRKHKYLGYILVPYIVTRNTTKNFFVIKDQINESNFDGFDFEFNEDEREIINITSQYSDQKIFKAFSKEATIMDFFYKVQPDFFTKHIQPYIERRINKCIEIIEGSNINLFYKNENYDQFFDIDEITINKEPASPVFNFIKDDSGFRYFLSIQHDKKEMKLTGRKGTVLVNEPCWLLIENQLYKFDDIDGKKLLPFFKKQYITIPDNFVNQYFETFVLNAVKKYKVQASGFNIKDEPAAKKAILSFEKDLSDEPSLIMYFTYNDVKFLSNNQTKFNVTFLKPDKKDKHEFEYRILRRDFEWEDGCRQKLIKLGFKAQNSTTYKLDLPHKPEPEQFNLLFVNWLNANKPLLKEEGFELVQDFFKIKYFTENITIDLKVEKKTDWFDIYGTVRFGKYEISFLKLRNHILEGKREYELPNGEIAVIPKEWFAEYKDLFIWSKVIMGHIKLDEHHFQLLIDRTSIDKSYFEDLKMLTQISENDDQTNPDILINADLRPYQKTGVKWLEKLRTHHFGGCLADDMGLGKTIQTICVLLNAIEKSGNTIKTSPNKPFQLSLFDQPELQGVKNTAASLIVMPASLIFNWYRELQKFAPHLRVMKYVGNRQKAIDEFNNSDVILSSYGIVRNDFLFLKEYKFFYIILDESQYIKNPESKTYNAITELEAEYRLVLTGTPIENSLTDLWAQLNFLNPGILGGLTFFKENFSTPIEKSNDIDAKIRLQKLIKPFILRRTKEEVAKDLPPMMEQVQYCSMSEAQKKIYDEEKSKARNKVLEIFEDETVENSKASFIILQALTRLRQLANHPALVIEDYNGDSCKFDEILLMLESIISENHKVLVFSTFVKYLNLFETEFQKLSWKYSILTGQTRNRAEVIDNFQNHPDNHLFLISLKAGGVGLNLTEADYVFILDPWWNPAAEMQAISRAHRIGQSKNVFVYRFITNETIEEKILNIQNKKSKLNELLAGSNIPFNKNNFVEILEMFD